MSPGKLCTPISGPLLKALRALLAHKPYRDRLPLDLYNAILEMCLDVLTRFDTKKSKALDESEEEDGGGGTSQSPSRVLGVSGTISTTDDLEIAKILGLIIVSGKDLQPHQDTLFDLFTAFFRSFPTESACVPHVLSAYNQVLYELGPNRVLEVCSNCGVDAPRPLSHSVVLTLSYCFSACACV